MRAARTWYSTVAGRTSSERRCLDSFLTVERSGSAALRAEGRCGRAALRLISSPENAWNVLHSARRSLIYGIASAATCAPHEPIVFPSPMAHRVPAAAPTGAGGVGAGGATVVEPGRDGVRGERAEPVSGPAVSSPSVGPSTPVGPASEAASPATGPISSPAICAREPQFDHKTRRFL